MKYRRDISSFLKLFGLVLVLFLGYQMWLKPAPLIPKQNVEAPASTAPLSSGSSFSLPESSVNPLWDVPPSRLVELGPPPSQALGLMRDELDRGHYSEVEQRLSKLSQKKVTNVSTRRYIAGLWNNLGVQQEKFGGTALSVKAFKQSVAWDSKNPLAHLNLTQAYWELRDPAMTLEFLETVIRLAPQNPFPHLALADLLLSKGKPALAATHIAQARSRAERDPNHQAYLRKLTAKVEALEPPLTAKGKSSQSPSTAQTEVARSSQPLVIPGPVPSPAPPSQKRMADKGSAEVATPKEPAPQSPPVTGEHFTVRFDGPPDEAAWIRMRAILNYAFEELSQKYGYVPSKPIPVVLHTNQKFMGGGGSPAWADSLFDGSSGAIHLPTQGAFEDLAYFSRVARHELVHSILFEQLKGETAAVPKWLIEGLAMHLAEDPWSDVDDAGLKTGAMIPLTSLQGQWKLSSGDAVHIAYLEARSAVQLLMDSYGSYGVRQVIGLVQMGRSLDAAMQQKLSVSYEQFHRQWAQNLKLPAKMGKS
jgi:tetratricopeptide (TPR) repeat protein